MCQNTVANDQIVAEYVVEPSVVTVSVGVYACYTLSLQHALIC